MGVPDWLRIVLLLLSLGSLLCQLQLLWLRRDSSKISLFYVLFSLLVATEQFAIHLVLLTTVDGVNTSAHKPAAAGDWLRLAQFGVIWVLWVLLYVSLQSQVESNKYSLVFRLLTNTPHLSFITGIILSPPSRSRNGLGSASAVYMSYLLISLVPVIAVTASGGPDNDRKWFGAMFIGFHIILVNPFITVLGVISVYPQTRAMPGHSSGAMSLVGLEWQAVAVLLGFIWSARFTWSYSILGQGFYSWSQMVGYVPLDDVVFAAVQAMLLYTALRHNSWRAISS